MRFARYACHSSLVFQTHSSNKDVTALDLCCAVCGAKLDADDVIEQALGGGTATEAHVAVKDGGDPPIETCPECDHEGYVTVEDRCAVCGFSMGGATCAVCDSPLSVEEYALTGGGLCSYHQYQMEKDD